MGSVVRGPWAEKNQTTNEKSINLRGLQLAAHILQSAREGRLVGIPADAEEIWHAARTDKLLAERDGLDSIFRLGEAALQTAIEDGQALSDTSNVYYLPTFLGDYKPAA